MVVAVWRPVHEQWSYLDLTMRSDMTSLPTLKARKLFARGNHICKHNLRITGSLKKSTMCIGQVGWWLAMAVAGWWPVHERSYLDLTMRSDMTSWHWRLLLCMQPHKRGGPSLSFEIEVEKKCHSLALHEAQFISQKSNLLAPVACFTVAIGLLGAK